jgi:hypothetical protein
MPPQGSRASKLGRCSTEIGVVEDDERRLAAEFERFTALHR